MNLATFLVLFFVCGGLCGPIKPPPPYEWDCGDSVGVSQHN